MPQTQKKSTPATQAQKHETQNNEPSKTLFLDRDGVVNVDHGYVSQPKAFEFIDGVFTACKQFQDAGYKIVIITNQSGIGRGYYSEQDFHALTDWMVAEFKKNDVDILAVYYCPHHPVKANAPYLQECDCRKPQPGMLLQAINQHNLSPNNSIMIGDKAPDMQAAIAAGIKHKYLVNSGQSFSSDVEELADAVFADLPAAANAILL
jgi:D-glycero-D-manno-heptose 1,7-bisphosphate phosphatase